MKGQIIGILGAIVEAIVIAWTHHHTHREVLRLDPDAAKKVEASRETQRRFARGKP
jgi:hypothetical protein